jgi:hypothetical protein
MSDVGARSSMSRNSPAVDMPQVESLTNLFRLGRLGKCHARGWPAADGMAMMSPVAKQYMLHELRHYLVRLLQARERWCVD